MKQIDETRRTLNALAGQQEALLTQIEDEATAQQRVWKAHPDSWSLAQVIHHVGLSAGSLLQAQRQSTQRGSTLKFLVMRVVLKSPARLKLPNGVPIAPDPNISWHEAVATARGALQQWSAYLDTTRDEVVFIHPFAGPLTVAQAVTFLHDHFNHHVPQVERILSKVGT